MIQIVAVHMEGYESLQHISTLRWVQVDAPGSAARTLPQDASREDIVDFVDKNQNQAFAMNLDETRYAYLTVVNANPPYVKTLPDGTTSDNLLSLPRY